jgi:hypothetical protein
MKTLKGYKAAALDQCERLPLQLIDWPEFVQAGGPRSFFLMFADVTKIDAYQNPAV